MTPVPPPSSTTRPDAVGSTQAAILAASWGELAQMAPTLAGCATKARRNTERDDRLTTRSTTRRTRLTPARAARRASSGAALPTPRRRANRTMARTPGALPVD